MTRVFQTADTEENMESQAFALVTIWIQESLMCLRQSPPDLVGLERCVTNLLILAYPLMREAEEAKLKSLRDEARGKLYSRPRPNQEALNIVTGQLETLLEKSVKILNVGQVLYRTRIETKNLSAR